MYSFRDNIQEKSKYSKKEELSDELKCPNCNSVNDQLSIKEDLKVCNNCDYHYRMNSYERIESIFEKDSVMLFDEKMITKDPISFLGYKEKVQGLRNKLKINSAVITGSGFIGNSEVNFAVMDYRFLMGSMGSVEGEKIARMIENATLRKIPVIIFSSSGGARIHEGAFSLIQMAKISAALKKHSNNNLIYISVLSDPTTGGIYASFASLGDIIIAEPNANIGFAGRRVIEQTINEKLPENFQTSEFLFENGFIDIISHRKDLKSTLLKILDLHKSNDNIKVKRYVKEVKCSKDIVDPWKSVSLVRNSKRPRYKYYINNFIEGFIELHGDRCYGDDLAIVGGIGKLNDINITVICSGKGNEISENMLRNFGMAHPEGYRKVLRLMKQAEKFNRPILCIVDTPGAFCGLEAEKRGQGEAIARCLMESSGIKVPIITVVIGEGGSGGALAMMVADYIYMFENSIFSVISPEGAASIIYKDYTKAKEVSRLLKLTSYDLFHNKIIDEIIEEPENGINYDFKEINNVRNRICEKFKTFMVKNPKELIEERYKKLRFRDGYLY